MGLDIVFSTQKHKYKWPLSTIEYEALHYLTKKGYGEIIQTLLNVKEFGEAVSIDKVWLIKSINKTLDAITHNPKLLPAMYNVQVEIPQGEGKYSTGGQAICGLKIDNELYDLEIGLDRCVLVKKWLSVDGKIMMGSPIDVRSKSVIKTDKDSFIGEVKIIQNDLSKGLIRKLKKLREFVNACSEAVIAKQIG